MNKITIKLAITILSIITITNSFAQENGSFREFPKDKKTVQLEKGTIRVFDYGDIKVHDYETKGFFNTHTIFIEKKGKGVLIETPPMKDNYYELINYIVNLGYKNVDVMVSYHLIGKTFFKTNKLKFNNIYSNKKSVAYMNNSGKESLKGLKHVSGDYFDDSIIKPTKLLEDGKITIAGINFIIKSTGIGFDVEMPDINAVHLHMLGHNNHTLVFNNEFVSTVINELKYFQNKGYSTYFSSHSSPETSGDATIKIQYLEHMKEILAESKNGKEFSDKMDKAYPKFGWKFYLMGSSELLFK